MMCADLPLLHVSHPAVQSRVHPEQPANTIPAEQVGLFALPPFRRTPVLLCTQSSWPDEWPD